MLGVAAGPVKLASGGKLNTDIKLPVAPVKVVPLTVGNMLEVITVPLGLSSSKFTTGVVMPFISTFSPWIALFKSDIKSVVDDS